MGLLGRLATTPALFEPFRNPATPDEICSCLLKLLEVRGESQREANRNKTRISEADYPKLWILTPTVSDATLKGIEQGIEQGISRERRELIENLLTVRFGTLDESLRAIIQPLVSLSPPEFLPLLMQFSREELLARFADQN